MKLILHIGAGKTGTTSIQNFLLRNSRCLEGMGIKYLGMMLEETFEIQYVWQDKHKNYHETMKSHRIKKEIQDVLQNTIRTAEYNNIHTLIWSNESILDNPHMILSALETLKNTNLTVELVMYVRDYLTWAQSAYLQWGIKHKTNEGNLQSFREFSNRVKPMFYAKLKSILEQYKFSVVIRNMDAAEDVVSDFMKTCSIGMENNQSTFNNTTPGQEELFFRALFNNNFVTQVMPNRYDDTIGKFLHKSDTIEQYLENLFPSDNDLKELEDLIKEDKVSINRMLHNQGQPTLGDAVIKRKKININHSVMLKMLSELVVNQAIRLDKIEKELDMIKSKQ